MRSRLFSKVLFVWCCLFAGQAFSAELKIVFGQHTPPYVFEDGTGIVIDIVRTALAENGHTMKPVYVPIDRGFKMFAEGQVDGSGIIQEGSGLKAAYSQTFMQYHNRAFALKSRNLNIRTLSDLGDKSVAAFQLATRYLGEDFARAVVKNPRYKEMAQQEAQTLMLLLGRIDVAVIDESIFRFYRQKLIAEGKADPEQAYIGYDILPPTPYRAAFADPSIRDGFDKAIAVMRSDGRYDDVYRKYVERYFEIRK